MNEAKVMSDDPLLQTTSEQFVTLLLTSGQRYVMSNGRDESYESLSPLVIISDK